MEKLHRHEPQNLDYEIRRIYLNHYEKNKALVNESTVSASGFLVGAVAGIDATIPIPPIAPLTVAGSATFVKGILTAYTPPS